MSKQNKRLIFRQKAYDVAIFDFDGTLVDSESVYPFLHKEVLRELGVPASETEYLTVDFWCDNLNTNKKHIDAPDYFIARHKLDGQTDPTAFRVLRQKIEIGYLSGEHVVPELEDFPNYANKPVISDLMKMYANGAKCFVVSHNYGNIIEHALRALKINYMFDDCFCHCAYDQLKHPTYDRNQSKTKSFREILANTGCAPERAVVYDDLRMHVEEARSLGMDAVWVDNEHARPPRYPIC